MEQNFNAFKYSDAESLAKADTEFLAAQKELEEHKSLTVEFQEKLERQNSKFNYILIISTIRSSPKIYV